jgi:hypothetical protein
MDEEGVSTSRIKPLLLANYSGLIKVSMDVTDLTHFIHGSVKNMMIKIESVVRLCPSEA